MIRVENLSKSFGDFKALDDVNMHVEKGSIYGLVGPNGAGKSTLIRHLTGAYIADAGTVKIDGEDLYENAALKQRVAYIPDNIWYYVSSNTWDMMKFYKSIYKNFDEVLFKKMLECFPAIKPKNHVRSLSKGMQKQVAFLLSIATRPDVLILDEPVDGLDPVMRRQIWSLIMNDVTERGTTVLVSSHNLRELEDVCDHVGIMLEGRLHLEKSLDELVGAVTKVQVAYEGDMPNLPDSFKILNQSAAGRVHTLIIKGETESVVDMIKSTNPLFVDAVPLTLEEVFVYEMGGEGYAVKDFII